MCLSSFYQILIFYNNEFVSLYKKIDINLL